jgi:SEC-C motif-containing protein
MASEMITACPCGSKHTYLQCCEPYLIGKQYPSTPEALMRSRYTAYTIVNIDYIQETMLGAALVGFQSEDAARWARHVTWMGLKVIHASLKTPSKGYVEFKASFMEKGLLKSMHEKSEFIKKKGRWYYTNGTQF